MTLGERMKSPQNHGEQDWRLSPPVRPTSEGQAEEINHRRKRRGRQAWRRCRGGGT